jgi:cell division ATPase FtsA
MEEIAWDVIEQVFSQTVRETGIVDYTLQQKIFSDIKKELTCQIEESLGRNVERMTREELKNIIRKAIEKVTKQPVTPEVI